MDLKSFSFGFHEVFLFSLIVLPGLVAIHVYKLLVPVEKLGEKEVSFYGIAISILLAIIFAPLHIYMFRENNSLIYYYFYVIFYSILMPIAATICYRKIVSLLDDNRLILASDATAWDFVFSRQVSSGAYVVVEMKNGAKIAGLFGRESFATSYPCKREIYIQQEYTLDAEGNFDAPVPGSVGVLLSAEDCNSIRVFKWT